MKPHVLLILIASVVFASVIAVNSQHPAERKPPMYNLCKTMENENYPVGRPIFVHDVVAVEMPAYPQKALANRVEDTVFVQVVVNQDGDVITATPIMGSNHLLWAAAVKASVTTRVSPQWLSRQTGDEAGFLLFQFEKGKVKLKDLPIRRGITNP